MSQPQRPMILPERDDDAIDKLLENPQYGPDYQVSVTISRKAGNLASKLRAGIVCPLVEVKTVAQACCDLVTGGGQLRVDVEHAVDGGRNKKRLLAPWFETFGDTPKIGQPYESLTLAWDPSGGPNNEGAWDVTERAGVNRRNEQTAVAAGQPLPPIAGPRVAAAPVFPTPQRGFDGRLLPPPPHLVPASLREYPADIQWQTLAGYHERQYGVRPSIEPVDIAMQWRSATSNDLERESAKAARLEEKLEGTRDRASIELAQANKRLADLERKLAEEAQGRARDLERAEARLREEKRDMEMAALRADIARASQAPRQEASRSLLSDPAAITALVGGLGTVFTAYMSAQAASADRQMQMTLALAKPPPTPPQKTLLEEIAPVVTAFAPIAGPAFAQWIANLSPAARMELEDARAQQQQVMFSMVMEQVKSMIPQDSPPPIWYEPVMTVLKGFMGAVNTAAITAGTNKMQALPAPLPAPQQQAPQQAQQQPAQQPAPQEERPGMVEARVVQSDPGEPPPIAPQLPDLEALITALSELDGTAGNVTRFVMRAMHANQVDPLFFTPEWVTIVFHLHVQVPSDKEEERAAKLVPEIVDHLEHCREFALLPKPLAEVFEKPESLGDMVSVMPLAMTNRPYADMLLAMFVEEVNLRERERKLELEGDEDEESGETEVAPPKEGAQG